MTCQGRHVVRISLEAFLVACIRTGWCGLDEARELIAKKRKAAA